MNSISVTTRCSFITAPSDNNNNSSCSNSNRLLIDGDGDDGCPNDACHGISSFCCWSIPHRKTEHGLTREILHLEKMWTAIRLLNTLLGQTKQIQFLLNTKFGLLNQLLLAYILRYMNIHLFNNWTVSWPCGFVCLSLRVNELTW